MGLFGKFRSTLPQVEGKTFAITGTTSGTGFVSAQALAELGGEVLLLNRPSQRATASLARLQKAVPSGKFVPVDCDLQDFASVRAAAAEIKSKYSSLFCLCNNAGIMATPDEATKDGFDTQMQTNHLAHFLLTAELYPLLEAEAQANGEARIVNHSSIARFMTGNKKLEEKYFGKNGGNLGGDEANGVMKGPAFERYFQTKLANSVFTQALHQKLQKRESNVRAICAHPGVASTSLSNHLDFGCLANLFMPCIMPLIAQSPEDGAMGILTAMVLPDAQSGILYGPKGKDAKGAAVANPPKEFEQRPDEMDMLWRTSEEATGVTFEL